MQKARSHPLSGPKTESRLLPLVCTRFQDLFHSPSGVLFTFPSRYSALSVTSSYLALEDGPPRFNRDFTCPGLLGYPSNLASRISRTGLSPSLVRRSRRVLLSFRSAHTEAPQPRQGLTPDGLGSSPFARRYSGNLTFDFFSSGYLDVSVPRVGSPCGVTGHHPCRVSPFGHPRICACLQLPEAYRSLPRPSSPART